MRSKKAISLLLTAAMAATAITGCSGNTKDELATEAAAGQSQGTEAASDWQSVTDGSGGIALPVTKDTTTYTYMAPENPASPVTEEFVVIPTIEEKTNLKFDMTWVPESNYADKLSVVLSSGSIPDYIGNVSVSIANNYGPKGLFLNIWDYMDYMPNLKRIFEEYPELEAYKYSDHELYTLPVQFSPDSDPQGFGYFQQVPMIRMDVLEELGLKSPETFEELHQVLAKLKEKYPDSYPWANTSGLQPIITQMLLAWNGDIFSYSNYYTVYDPQTKKYSFAPEREGFREMIAYLTDLYKEGLIDPEFLSTDNAQWEERLLNNKAFFTYANWNKSQNLTVKGQAAGSENYELMGIKPPVEQGKASVIVRDVCSGTNVVSAKAQNPEILLQALDYWLYSKDGTMLSNAGIEGVNFEWAEKDKIYKLVDSSVEMPTNETHKNHFGVRYGWMTGLRPDNLDIHNFVEEDDLMHQQFLVYQGTGTNPPPVIIFRNSDDASNIKQVGVPVRDYLEQQLAKIICGYESIDTWDSMIASCKDMGSDQIVEILNAQ